MTDHRVTDLTYGHVGEAAYDIEEQSWTFSRDPTPSYLILPLGSLQECLPSSCSDLPGSAEKPTISWYMQKKWLLKVVPEAVPATTVLASVCQTPGTAHDAPRPSALLAVGNAVDVLRKSGAGKFQVMAMAHGEAGNVLRLIKPRIEALGWGGTFNSKLLSLNPAFSDECYWQGGGGAIQRICFAADNDGPASWLAVQKAECTTIFQPMFQSTQIPARVSRDQTWRYPASRLDANPILTLTSERTGARPHADVSFNPWYIRQFAIVDQRGCWSVWDIEGQERKRMTYRAIPGKTGHIHDGLKLEESLKEPHNHDGWGRIMWSGSVSTLVVLNRRHLAIFDLNTIPRRLYSPDLVEPDSAGWILDARRSPTNLNHIFVLTTSRIFWLQITVPAEGRGEQNGHIGARILLSCRHFRDEEDETAQLELIKTDNQVCNVFLYSSQTSKVNTYRFHMSNGSATTPVYSQGSFTLSGDIISSGGSSGTIQTLCVLPTSFKLHRQKPISGPAKEYTDNDIRFYQLFSLNSNFGIHHALCAIQRQISDGSSAQQKMVLAPTIKDTSRSKIKQSSRIIRDDFIVPDELEEPELAFGLSQANDHTLVKHNGLDRGWRRLVDDKVLSINARRLFEVSFIDAAFEEVMEDDDPKDIAEYIKNIELDVETRIAENQEGLATLCDLAKYTSFSDDIDEASSSLMKFIDFLEQEDDSHETVTFKTLALVPSLFVDSASSLDAKWYPPDLSTVYDMMVGLWVGCLPHNIPGPARLARERTVRSAATELYLSSLVTIIRNKSVPLPKPAESRQGIDFVLPVRVKPDSGAASSNYNTPITSSAPVPSSPPPDKSRSPPPRDDSQPTGEPEEDESVSRLRSYAISIKSQPPLGSARSAILAHWPPAPGSDPAMYSWEDARKATAEDAREASDEEETLIWKREQERRHRRTENFLKRQRANTSEAALQPMPNPAFGSQPALPKMGFGTRPDPSRHVNSSQSVDLPMTQPDRGIFGSRHGQKTFKKRRTKGF